LARADLPDRRGGRGCGHLQVVEQQLLGRHGQDHVSSPKSSASEDGRQSRRGLAVDGRRRDRARHGRGRLDPPSAGPVAQLNGVEKPAVHVDADRRAF
jgi:hypothetical protein